MTTPNKPIQTPVPASLKDNPMIAKGLEEAAGMKNDLQEAGHLNPDPVPVPHVALTAPLPVAQPPPAAARRKLTTDQLSWMRDQISLPSVEGQRMTVSLPEQPEEFRLIAHPCKSRPELDKADHFRWRVLDVDPVL